MNNKIAIYLRLSLSDGDLKKGSKDESNSIENQRLLLHSYIEKQDDLSGEIVEYVDDGYTGTNFNRPAFQKMIMQEKKSITLQCVDVDDLKKQAEMIRAEQIKLYESYADGILTRNEYLEKKKGLGEKLADLQEKIRIEEEEQETADELDEEIRSLTKQASQKTYIGGLTKECVDAFVSMVYLYDDQTMKVEFNCEDVIRRALEKYGA